MKNAWIVLVAVVVIIAVAIFGTWFYLNSNDYIAKVGGEKITKAEFKLYLSMTRDQMESAAGIDSSDPAARAQFWSTPVNGKSPQDIAKDNALDVLKEIKIQYIKAKEAGVSLTAQDKADFEKKVNDEITSHGGEKQYSDYIKTQYGITLSEYKKIVSQYVLVNKFVVQTESTIKYTDDDLKTYYNQNKDNFDYVTVRHVLFLTVDPKNRDSNGNMKELPKDKQAEAEKKADEILAKAKAGEDMTALVEKYSEDSGKEANKGEYSFYKDGADISGQGNYYVQEFPEWAFKSTTKVGDIGKIKTDYGFHIIKLEKRTSFDDLKDIVKKYYLDKQYKDKMLTEWKKDKKYDITSKKVSAINSVKII